MRVFWPLLLRLAAVVSAAFGVAYLWADFVPLEVDHAWAFPLGVTLSGLSVVLFIAAWFLNPARVKGAGTWAGSWSPLRYRWKAADTAALVILALFVGFFLYFKSWDPRAFEAEGWRKSRANGNYKTSYCMAESLCQYLLQTTPTVQETLAMLGEPTDRWVTSIPGAARKADYRLGRPPSLTIGTWTLEITFGPNERVQDATVRPVF